MNAEVIADVESDDPCAAYISCSETYIRKHDIHLIVLCGRGELRLGICEVKPQRG
jgi:hypothetical protein